MRARHFILVVLNFILIDTVIGFDTNQLNADSRESVFSEYTPGDTQKSGESTPSSNRPKVGIVLSGGGAKGLAHIGFLRVLEEVNMPIDFIGGTSMGAIVGGLFAIGYSATEIEEIVRTENWSRLFTDEVRRRYIPIEEKVWDATYMLSLPIVNRRITLPSGLIAGQEISKLFTRLTIPVHGVENFNEFKIPFVAITTDMATGDAIVLRNGYLPDAMRASMAIPTVFTPFQLDHRTTIDGGVARNFPVTDVLEMGADYVIGINVSSGENPADSLNTLFQILNKTVFYQIQRTTRDQARLVDLLITPDLSSADMLSFDSIPTILRKSSEEAEKIRPRLQSIADSINTLRGHQTRSRTPIPNIDDIHINEIHVHNIHQTTERIILSELNIEPGSIVTPEQIELGIDRVYSLQYFETVRYRLLPAAEGMDLHVYIKEKLDDQFRIGLRYDNRTKSSLLFNATFRNAYKPTSTLRFNVRLGEESYYDAQYFYYVGFKPKLGVHVQGNFSTIKSDIFDLNGNIETSGNTQSFKAEFWTGPVVSSTLIMGIGLREEVYRVSKIIGLPVLDSGWRNNHSLFGFLWIDTKNDAVFPTRGQMFRADVTKSLDWFGNPVIFNEYKARWENYFSINDHISIRAILYSAMTSGEVPTHLRPYLGGYPDFPGYYRFELQDEWIVSFRPGIQIEVANNRYLIAEAAFGRTSSRGNFDLTEHPIRFGWSLTGALNSVVGPVKLGIHGSNRNNLLADIQVGYHF